MIRLVLRVIFVLFLVAPGAWAQAENAPSSGSTVPSYGRFQVVQSPLLAALTMRLDRFTGDTWQLVESKKFGFEWQPIKRRAGTRDTTVPDKVNYQIFLSGLVAKATLLENINTGASWYIAKGKNGTISWEPIEVDPAWLDEALRHAKKHGG